jgi:transcriptional regulator GlxA family with amidase domain
MDGVTTTVKVAHVRLCHSHIAVTCGFCSQQHMTGTFSRKLGVTPQQFRSHPVKYGKG